MASAVRTAYTTLTRVGVVSRLNRYTYIPYGAKSVTDYVGGTVHFNVTFLVSGISIRLRDAKPHSMRLFNFVTCVNLRSAA